MANARAKAEQADQSALKAEQDSDSARLKAKEFAPEFHQPGTFIFSNYTVNYHNYAKYSDTVNFARGMAKCVG